MSKLALFIGERLRSLRKARGLTQEQLGELVGIPQSYIGNIERGQTYIQIDTFEKILEALDINPEEVFRTFKFTNREDRIIKEKKLDSLYSLLISRDIEEINVIERFAKDILTTVDKYKK